MPQLLGEYPLSLDDKGRPSVPSALRASLRDLYAPEDDALVVTKYFEDCLVIYPLPIWRDISTQLFDLPNDPTSRAFRRHFFASATECRLDRQGRILVPAKLRQYAGLTSEALLIGMIRNLELWSPERWNDYEDSANAQFDNNSSLMGLKL